MYSNGPSALYTIIVKKEETMEYGCLEERKQRKVAQRKASSDCGNCPEVQRGETIVTVRDHAHLMIELIDGVLSILFDVPTQKLIWDPATIGRAHARLIPFGFDKALWHSLGEVFAEGIAN
ncbi:hypothetical protein niasHT_028934 [Heterodera trifolii]|uniref:Uncharacterized protein n=1 Tax=Heterodera trifolii TaxID=157864 RepID=A0ABD2KNN9_9BILA